MNATVDHERRRTALIELSVSFSWQGPFLVTLVAHVLAGVTMGLLVEHGLTAADRGWLVASLFADRRNAVLERQT